VNSESVPTVAARSQNFIVPCIYGLSGKMARYKGRDIQHEPANPAAPRLVLAFGSSRELLQAVGHVWHGRKADRERERERRASVRDAFGC
jgi:hypothetical protein